MKKIVIVFLVFSCYVLFSNAAHSQSWQWGRRGGGAGGSANQAEKIVDMATDKNGNVYMLAQLDGGTDAVVSIDGTKDSALIDKLQGSRDAVLMSYDCSGKLRWLKVFGSASDERAASMTMDSLGHIYVAMETDMDFYVDVDSFAVNSKRKSIGLIQYDTAGHFKWFRQANPDSVSKSKNLGDYAVFKTATTANGDTYMFCFLGTGLIAGSSNLVVTQAGLYMLKYNVAGVPKELIKLDMVAKGVFWSYVNFNVTKSRKFVFSVIKNSNMTATDSFKVGGQSLKHTILLSCFSPTGSVLWKVENSDTVSGGIDGRPYIDESKGLIYVCGGGVWGYDSLQGIPFNNNIANTLAGSRQAYIAVVDTLGNVKYIANSSSNTNSVSVLADLTFRSDGRLFAGGYGGDMYWGSYNFKGGNGIGYQVFVPSFDAATGNIMSMDSLMSTSSFTYPDVLAADKNNNVYLAGRLTSNINIAGQSLQSTGGQSDFFVAKYGSNNCGLVPLRFLSLTASPTPPKEGHTKIILDWQTASEVNVSRFNIQRSTNGRDFETVGMVMAKNKQLNNYTYIDNLQGVQIPPLEGGEALYFRIESIDYDGSKQYSEVRKVELGSRNVGISVYPNPARDIVNISSKQGISSIKVVNLYGKIIQEYAAINNNVYRLQTSELTNGIYWITITLKDGSITTQKLLIER